MAKSKQNKKTSRGLASKIKRGFTLVELVIVIAVIAVLSAILIPTFSNVIQNANRAKDTANAKSMSTKLLTMALLDGVASYTPSEARAYLKQNMPQYLTTKSNGSTYWYDYSTGEVKLMTVEEALTAAESVVTGGANVDGAYYAPLTATTVNGSDGTSKTPEQALYGLGSGAKLAYLGGDALLDEVIDTISNLTMYAKLDLLKESDTYDNTKVGTKMQALYDELLGKVSDETIKTALGQFDPTKCLYFDNESIYYNKSGNTQTFSKYLVTNGTTKVAGAETGAEIKVDIERFVFPAGATTTTSTFSGIENKDATAKMTVEIPQANSTTINVVKQFVTTLANRESDGTTNTAKVLQNGYDLAKSEDDQTQTSYDVESLASSVAGAVAFQQNATPTNSNVNLITDESGKLQEYFGTTRPVVTVAVLPDFYSRYISNSQGTKEEDNRSVFTLSGDTAATYEVGNVNKFIFRPTLTVITESNALVRIKNPKTYATVYEIVGDNKTKLEGQDLDQYIKIDGTNNTYQFTKEAAEKIFKVVITFDENLYDLSLLKDSESEKVSFECKVVDGGYNVYDQMGLSVVNDLNSYHWQDLWRCEIDSTTFAITSNANSLKLEADDKPLCEYVYDEKVQWAILHGDITLNADLMPDYFFWSQNDDGFTTAKGHIEAIPVWQDSLEGTMRDGVANGSWWRVMNMDNPENEQIAKGHGLEYKPNMQKGLFATSRVSISGNYNTIKLPGNNERSKIHNRLLASYVGYGESEIYNPPPHWSIFQMYQKSKTNNGQKFVLKNLASSGNNKQGDYITVGEGDKQQIAVPAGPMFLVSYSTDITISNVNCNSFFGNFICDNYGTSGDVKIENSKFYDSYSNMMYLWRAKATVKNSKLIGSGGPLFILCDGKNIAEKGVINNEDSKGSNLTVDESSVLEAFATGNESWYAQYKANTLVNAIQGYVEPLLKQLGKTVITKSENTLGYINVIAAMICNPGDLITGITNTPMHVRGSYTTVKDDTKTEIEKFAMNNKYLKYLRDDIAKDDATQFPIIIQYSNELYAYADTTKLYTFTNQTPKTEMNEQEKLNWKNNNDFKNVALYMSTGSLGSPGTKDSPYFGVILGAEQYPKTE